MARSVYTRLRAQMLINGTQCTADIPTAEQLYQDQAQAAAVPTRGAFPLPFRVYWSVIPLKKSQSSFARS